MGGVLGRLWMVLFLRVGGEEEETPGHGLLSHFFTGRLESPNSPFFVLYIVYRSVGVSFHQVSDHRESVLDLDNLDRHVWCSSVDNSTISSTY
jgi:hypothetical protein